MAKPSQTKKSAKQPALPPEPQKEDPVIPRSEDYEDVHADGCTGVYIFNDTIRIVLERTRTVHTANGDIRLERVIVRQITLPVKTGAKVSDLVSSRIRDFYALAAAKTETKN